MAVVRLSWPMASHSQPVFVNNDVITEIICIQHCAYVIYVNTTRKALVGRLHWVACCVRCGCVHSVDHEKIQHVCCCCLAIQERINTFAVPTAPLILFQPLILRLAHPGSASKADSVKSKTTGVTKGSAIHMVRNICYKPTASISHFNGEAFEILPLS